VTDLAVSDQPETEPQGGRKHASAGKAATVGLSIGALGVVFGDIGTSPLYALQTVFSLDGGAVRPKTGDVYGVLSLVFWSITVVVSIKYVLFVMRADNDGEGGVLALAALLRRLAGSPARRAAILVGLGLFGASLFYGDSVITPAISVLSAVEGLKVAAPSLHRLVLPISAVILAVLFFGQRWGTHRVGQLFGPVMVLWFLILALMGIPHIVDRPGVLRALSPTYIVSFVAAHPYTSFLAMGGVVLAITGAEALYADMGHFGPKPIRLAWFVLVFPALTINYFGQGALILSKPATAANPFYLLVPSWAQIPLIVLATLATVIASQAVISGAFSVSRQAVRLGVLPPLTVRQTSSKESGQIYVPAVNAILFVSVLVLVFGFRSSASLASAYGVAVTGTFLITTGLFLAVASIIWHWPVWRLVVLGLAFGVVEVLFFAANLTKVVHGGWLPLTIAAVLFTLMTTWQHGRTIVTRRRDAEEGDLSDFLSGLHAKSITRVRGTAVFPHASRDTTPLALRANVALNQVLHEQVVIIHIQYEDVPHVAPDQRVVIRDIGTAGDGITFCTVRCGFQDRQDIPALLARARELDPDLQVEDAFYFLSRINLRRGPDHSMARWRKMIFLRLARTATSPAVYFHLPEERTVIMSVVVEL
jgi:KUP system potassium uptake protein